MAKRKSTKPPPFHFEKALDELDHLVDQMESEQLDLEKSLQLFERGISLIKTCQRSLTDAEQKVQKLTKDHDQMKLLEFEQEN